jgi:hypothetical protein
MYYLLQIALQKTKTINEISKNNYNSNDKSQHLIIHCLNTVGNQQEILATRVISYLLNLPNHKIDQDFIYIPWCSLLAWVNEQEKIQNVQNENDNDIDVNYETFIVDKNSSNQ